MYDPNLVEFYGRVAKFEKSHAKGFGHEAPGTLSRSVTYGRVKARLRFPVMPLVVVTLAVFGLKAVILHHVGATDYQSRVEALQSGQGFDRLGGWLMQADPLTMALAAKIGVVANL
jgi:predicted DNA repair protein MutK